MSKKTLEELFPPNCSPYFSMYTAGLLGYHLEEIISHLQRIGVSLREKDVKNWTNGRFRYQMRDDQKKLSLEPRKDIPKNIDVMIRGKSFEDTILDDFQRFPDDWVGTDKRFFPCSENNMPMCRWGWTPDYVPELYAQSTARALSPCGWIGQNMLYQRFMVLDIDGVGHGTFDEEVIEFGRKYSDRTMTLEDPMKPGSFHLYFSTDRLIPVKHFPFAKLDLMGNSKNAAVYLKNKRPNGLPMLLLTDSIWQDMMSYIKQRKENR